MRWVATIIFLYINLAVTSSLAPMHLPLGWLGNFAVTLLLAFVAILVHEVGHAWVAHRQGAVVQSIMVMIFHFRLNPRRLTVIPPSGLGDVGGHVTCSFTERWWTMRKDAIVAIAGPGANFALAIVAWAVASFFNSGILMPHVAQTSGFLPSDAEVTNWFFYKGITTAGGSLATALSILSAGMGFANLIPFKGSDGAKIKSFLFQRRRR